MSKLTKKEYLDLINSIQDIDDYDYDDIEWCPAEPLFKPKPRTNIPPIIDLTNVKAEDIEEKLNQSTRFSVGTFQICISADGQSFRVTVCESITKTPGGFPCKMDNPINFEKDKRFKTRPWLQYTYKNMVNNITKDIVIDIIRWLIMLRKMIAFT